ncbi:MAG: MBL fold metallo-hydrolase [Deltaproteobacteria bacterium]|jgi:glyoxylase-like metal-dependent hydrolase (beta-lactamase superfamily II)|nr:MBL fold metallo-hydrolase [Deltaproteobacteria bacterium]
MQFKDDIYFYPGQNGMNFSGEINCNTVLIKGSKHLLIDPGIARRYEELLAAIRSDNIDPSDIGLVLLTHGHPDHAEASIRFKADFGIKAAMSNVERQFLGGVGRTFYRKDFYKNTKAGSKYRISEYILPDKSMFIPVFSGPFLFENRQYRLYDTPGHSPGGLCFHWPESGLLVIGDNYFPGTIGAYDLPGGNFRTLAKSLTMLSGLLDVEMVMCGHGEAIVGREQVRQNYAALFDEIKIKENTVDVNEESESF